MSTSLPSKANRIEEPSLADRLEEDILFGRLRPRERLVEDDLIERVGATRHAVRQALVDLELRQLVVRIPNKGAQVCDFTRTEIQEVCQMRDWLHELAARSIPLPASDDWINTLQGLQQQHARAVQSGHAMRVHKANNAFHDALFQGCGNRYLVQTIHDYAQKSLAYRCHLMTRIDLAERARDEHQQMIDAIRRGDSDRLARLCLEHTRAAREVYESLQGWSPSTAEPAATNLGAA
jgi:DNA-binding GntR family transcriptional regulator